MSNVFDGSFTTEPEFRYPGLWDGRIGSWFPGLGCQGAGLYDWSNSWSNGSLTGSNPAAAWSLNQGLTAYQAAGTSDYFNCGSAIATTLAGLPRASITLWVYSSVSNTNWFFGVGQSGTHRFTISQYNNSMGLAAENGGTTFRNTTNTLTGWNHYAGTFSSGLFTVYVNGKVVTSGGTTPSTLGTTGNCYIGSDQSNSRYSTAGAMYDDLAIYNRVLSVDEILTLYGNGFGRGTAYLPAEALLQAAAPSSAGLLLYQRRRGMLI